MPESYPTYPSRLLFAQYLEAYQIAMNVNVQTQKMIQRADYLGNDGWKVFVLDVITKELSIWYCKHLIVAIGVYNDPIIPSIPGDKEFKGKIIHSSQYTNATDMGFAGKKVNYFLK